MDGLADDLLGAPTGSADTVYDSAGMGKHFKGPSVLEQALEIVRPEGSVVVVADEGSRIGTVTPLTNNGELASYPQWMSDNPYELEISHAELDRMAAELPLPQLRLPYLFTTDLDRCAGVAVVTNMPPLGLIITLVGYFGLLFLL